MTATITYPERIATSTDQPFDGDAHTLSQAEHGNTAAARRAQPALFDSPSYSGSLWERASDLNAFSTNKRGTILCYRIMEGVGLSSRAADLTQYPTIAAAKAAIERYSNTRPSLRDVRIIAAWYFTKSGRIVKQNWPEW